MYERFFHFESDPFGVSPDERFFFASAQHAEALASLCYAILERRGFAVLIAAPGLGKTTVLARLAARMNDRARVAFLVHPELNGAGVLESVLLAMGVEPVAEPVKRYRQLYAFLESLHRESRTCVVIFDEAQRLNPEALESVRMLSNFETPTHKLIQFVLAGQPQLADLLKRSDCEQIRQRINVVATLEPLNREEVAQYVEHRLQVAGSPASPFTPDAIEALARESGGVPRNINTIAFNALTLAFADESRKVTAAAVAEAVADLNLETRRERRAALPPQPPQPAFFGAMVPGGTRPYWIAAGIATLSAFLYAGSQLIRF